MRAKLKYAKASHKTSNPEAKASQETYYRGKRDLLQRQKRPTTEAKETYYRGKSDLEVKET